MKPLYTLIIAAGKGTRMKSDIPKVLHPLLGKAMVEYVVRSAKDTNCSKIFMVIGYKEELMRERLKDQPIDFVIQHKQLGTAHAVMQAHKKLADKVGTVLILSGDVPLITPATLNALIDYHHKTNAIATLLTTCMEDPSGYGRILRNKHGQIEGIIEESDATPEQLNIKEVNCGIYCFEIKETLRHLEKIECTNEQKEYYLTDLISLLRKEKKSVEGYITSNSSEVMGINNRSELAVAARIMRHKILHEHMINGVTIVDPETTFIDDGISIGRDTVIYPMVSIEGESALGSHCSIYSFSRINNCIIGDRVTILSNTVIEESRVDSGAKIGPFSRMRPQSVIGENVKIGNFVEIKKSKIGKGSKASHLSYIGDAQIGEKVNIGAGTITCNYDGVRKHRTIIENEVFIGSNTELIAPVKIKRGAYVGAGSTVTKDVPPFSLITSRSRQKIIKDWALHKKKDK
jgi:bifunctional UDP-N-acetylglucosamine pyrophosphorylase/glucosamine-1-phosphate N-acetyltransferase